jgi:hypothetical protein
MPELKRNPSADDIIADDYQILRLAGSGGMGLFTARDLKLERTVALKFLPPELSNDPASRQRILREARTALSMPPGHVTFAAASAAILILTSQASRCHRETMDLTLRRQRAAESTTQVISARSAILMPQVRY